MNNHSGFLKKIFKHKYTIKIASLVLVIVLVGYLTHAEERYKDLQIFTKVLNLIQKYYVEDVDTTKLIYGGIKGMIAELDPHSNFLPPEYLKEFQEETSGEFNGVGVEISIQNDQLTVISPIEDTSAWKAGIKAGDKIVSINGASTKGFSLADAAQKMKGKSNKVELGIMREGFKKPQIFSLERGTVKVKSVKFTNLDLGFGYFRVTGFIENTFRDFKNSIEDLKKINSGVIKGVVIDLRNNPGGLFDQSTRLADLFLKQGTIVSTMGRGGQQKDIVYATAGDDFLDFPIVVMINEFSASASEILAGALQDNGRAVVLGQRSFGKGSVQQVVKLGDGSGLKLTVSRYYTPKGSEIQSMGIRPDLVVDEVDREAYEKAKIKRNVKREQDLEGHLNHMKESQKSQLSKSEIELRDKLLSDDFQVLQAYNYLRAWKVFKDAVNPPETK